MPMKRHRSGIASNGVEKLRPADGWLAMPRRRSEKPPPNGK
jgi:hypothetical protein